MIQKKRFLTKKKLLLFFILLVGGYILISNNLSAQVDVPDSPTVSSVQDQWWNDEYSYRKKIDAGDSTTAVFEINHAEMVVEGKSNSDGNDLKVVAQKDNESSIVSINLSKPDVTNTKIEFTLLKDNSYKYYLYYGNRYPEQTKVLGATKISLNTNSSLELEESPIFTINTQKKWVLKDSDTKSILLSLQTKERIENASDVYAVINNNTDNKIKSIYKDGIITVPSGEVKVGRDKVYILIKYNGTTFRTNTTIFNYSYPLYVAWTIDWEGTIPDYKYLGDMENISEDFSIPMTQYFNPRIYINLNITDEQRKYVSDWLKKRYVLGDDIGMHMHMQHDMVEEAGVKAKYDAQSWDNGVSGYDTPSTDYTHDEYLKILDWGKNELKTQLSRFSNFDIPDLQGYRAGGWFANLDTLRAIQDAGFIYDTSGRSPLPLGANKITQTWNLKTTSQPYYISKDDQNSDTPPVMALKELPDNGMDSYWSAAEELIQNFYSNYNPGDVLTSDKIVVFLSHPDWFYIDEPKLTKLFTEISKYKNEYDMGPVKFVTLRNYLAKSDYINSLDKSN